MTVTSTLKDVDTFAVERACEHLGITKDVHIALAWGWGYRASYEGLKDDVHQIRIVSQDKLSGSIWHELTHALQCERDYACDFSTFNGNAYQAFEALGGYNPATVNFDDYLALPWEVEARANEALAVEHPLVFPQPKPEPLITDFLYEKTMIKIENSISFDDYLYGKAAEAVYTTFETHSWSFDFANPTWYASLEAETLRKDPS